jgi:PilZ domain
MDLRRQPRFPVHLQSKMSGQVRGEWDGMVTNLSKSGCRIETDGKVFAGMQVSLQVAVPGETAPLLIERAAVRWNRGREVGVGFMTVAPPQQARLDQLLEQVKQGLNG